MSQKHRQTLFDIFTSQTVIDLQLHKKFLDVRVRSNARKTELADALAKALVENPVTCLKRFPLYELRFLKHSAAYGKGNGVEFNKTSMHLHSLPLGLAVILEPEEDESVFDLHILPEVYDIIAPYLDTAIQEIESSPRLEFENFFWGCLTLYGAITYTELFNIAERIYPDMRDRMAFARFLSNYPAVEWTKWRNHLVHPCADWDEIMQDRKEHSLEKTTLKSFPKEDILDAGETMPYSSVWHHHPEGQGVIGALRAIGIDNDRLVYSLHRLWIAKEVCGKNAKAFNAIFTSILEGGRISGGIDTVNEVAGRMINYTNAIPCWGFKGRSSDDLFKRDKRGSEKLTNARAVVHRMANISRQASAFPKVGRNDPCPCGSGLKYKNCHGKNQN